MDNSKKETLLNIFATVDNFEMPTLRQLIKEKNFKYEFGDIEINTGSNHLNDVIASSIKDNRILKSKIVKKMGIDYFDDLTNYKYRKYDKRLVVKLYRDWRYFYSYSVYRRDKPIQKRSRFKTDYEGNVREKTQKEIEEEERRIIQSSVNRTIRTFKEYANANKWFYMATFTFDDKKAGADSSQYRSEAIKKLKNFFNMIKKKQRSFKMLATMERGNKNTKRLHFHALVGKVDEELLERFNSLEEMPVKLRKYGLDRVFKLPTWNYGYTTFIKLEGEEVQEKVVNYVIKYVIKELAKLREEGNKNLKSYFKTHNVDKALKLFLPVDELPNFDVVKEMDYCNMLKPNLLSYQV